MIHIYAWDRREEQIWFYEGYGPTTVDPVALAYYRYERFVEDIAEYAERLMLTGEGGADRESGFVKFVHAFIPGGVVDIAFRIGPLGPVVRREPGQCLNLYREGRGMMPKLAANLTTLFTDVPPLERFARARAAGFRHVEVLFPYDVGVEAVAEQARANGLQIVLFNIAAGNRGGW